jgi:hypothetical protein
VSATSGAARTCAWPWPHTCCLPRRTHACTARISGLRVSVSGRFTVFTASGCSGRISSVPWSALSHGAPRSLGVSRDEHGAQPVQDTQSQRGALPPRATLPVVSECRRRLEAGLLPRSDPWQLPSKSTVSTGSKSSVTAATSSGVSPSAATTLLSMLQEVEASGPEGPLSRYTFLTLSHVVATEFTLTRVRQATVE